MKIKNISKNKRKPNYQLDCSFGFDSDGNRNRIVKRGFPTRAAAEEYYNKLAYKHSTNDILFNNRKLLYKDFLLDFYENKKRKLSINTQIAYENKINKYIIPDLGHIPVTKIDVNTLQKFYNALLDKMVPNSANKIMTIVDLSLRYALSIGLINKLPVIEKDKVNTKVKTICSKEELKIILDHMRANDKNNYYLATLIAVTTGMRIAEICGLRWDEVDLVNKAITVKQQAIYNHKESITTISEILKTDTSYRIISIPDSLVNELMQRKDKTGFIVKNKYGLITSPKNLSQWFSRQVKFINRDADHNIPKITFHSLRHIHATLLLQNDVNIKVISKRLGHKNIQTTLDIYSHVLDEMQDKAMQIINKIF